MTLAGRGCEVEMSAIRHLIHEESYFHDHFIGVSWSSKQWCRNQHRSNPSVVKIPELY